MGLEHGRGTAVAGGPDAFGCRRRGGKQWPGASRLGLAALVVALVAAVLASPSIAAAALSLTWSDNSSNETGFKIERRTGTTGTFAQVATTGANVASYTDTTAVAGTTSCYRVRAYNAAGNSAYTLEQCAPEPAMPTVTIVANDPTATEAGVTTGAFTVSRTGSTAAPLAVSWSISGTAVDNVDRLPMPVGPTIPAGASSVVVTVTPLDDTLVEGPETVIATLTAGPGYTVGSPSTATVTIVDNDVALPVVTIVAAMPARPRPAPRRAPSRSAARARRGAR